MNSEPIDAIFTREQRKASISALAGVFSNLKPPPKLTVSQWADRSRRLDSQSSAEPGRWTTARAEYQRGIMDAFSDPKTREIVLMCASQLGKALDVATPIATPGGWTTMGDIKPGDTVFGADGSPTQVVAVSGIMHDHRCYRVKFCDGTEIVADGGHKWAGKTDNEKPFTLTTEQMFEAGVKNGNRNRFAIPVAKPLQSKRTELPIDPYVLGAWLGDGHSVSARIFSDYADADLMAERIEAAGHRVQIDKGACAEIRIDPKRRDICPYGHDKNVTGWSRGGCAECGRFASKNNQRVKRGLEPYEREENFERTFPRLLLELDLIGNKHIPTAYLRASEEQRWELLRGLMDTDGHATKSGYCEFVTTSEQIAAGMQELLSSLGIKYRAKLKPIKVGKDAIRFNFVSYRERPCFSMPRKTARLKWKHEGRPGEAFNRRVIAIEPVESRPVQCIQVDAPDHLFLAGRNMVPTHNSEVILNIAGYFIEYDPCPILILQPTVEMAQSFSKDRVTAGLIAPSPALSGIFSEGKMRNANNTTLHKIFPGGALSLVGANSPSALASRPIRIVLCDEIDRYPLSAGEEGDPVSLARRRTATFWNAKIAQVSTPTHKGSSAIEREYGRSDQRKYHVPCPHCGSMQELRWANVKWEGNDSTTARYECEHCHEPWTDAQRHKSLAHGEWRAEAEFRGVAGFHLNGLYSPWYKLESAVEEFLQAKKDPMKLKTFVNTFLAETWEDQGESVEDHEIAARAEDYEGVPEDVVALTAGVDVQDDRLEIEIVGWGPAEETWQIGYHQIYGDPSGKAVWNKLDEILEAEYPHPTDTVLHILSCCIDSGGHHTRSVYDYVKRKGHRRFAIKGVGGEGKPVVGRPTRNNIGKIPLYPVGVDTAKEVHFARLKIDEPGPGYCHFPKSRDMEYFRQLTAEKRVTQHFKGRSRRAWVKKRVRNEALDVRVYAIAAFAIMNTPIDRLVHRFHAALEKEAAKKDKEQEPIPENPLAPAKRRRPQGGGFANSWR